MLDDASKAEEGPIQKVDPEKVSKESPRILEGFEWVTMDLEQEKQVRTLSYGEICWLMVG